MRQCDVFLNERGQLLGAHGFTPDPGRIEDTAAGNLVFYHYSRQEHLESIFAPGSGLWARLKVVHCNVAPEFEGCCLVEGLLEPLPAWVTQSPYFGDFGLEMLQTYVGDVLLRVEVPPDFPGLYVAELAHSFECKHIKRRGQAALKIGYDCRTGQETCRAEVLSYIPVSQYHGGHVAPNVKVVRHGQGVAVPREYVSICQEQPLARVAKSGD